MDKHIKQNIKDLLKITVVMAILSACFSGAIYLLNLVNWKAFDIWVTSLPIYAKIFLGTFLFLMFIVCIMATGENWKSKGTKPYDYSDMY